MPFKNIDDFEVEFTAEPLEGSGQWGAFVAIYAPSANPMHMTNVYRKQRVTIEHAYPDRAAAEAAAESAALAILAQLRG